MAGRGRRVGWEDARAAHLQARVEQLEGEVEGWGLEYDRVMEENNLVKVENEKVKEENKLVKDENEVLRADIIELARRLEERETKEKTPKSEGKQMEDMTSRLQDLNPNLM